MSTFIFSYKSKIRNFKWKQWPASLRPPPRVAHASMPGPKFQFPAPVTSHCDSLNGVKASPPLPLPDAVNIYIFLIQGKTVNTLSQKKSLYRNKELVIFALAMGVRAVCARVLRQVPLNWSLFGSEQIISWNTITLSLAKSITNSRFCCIKTWQGVFIHFSQADSSLTRLTACLGRTHTVFGGRDGPNWRYKILGCFLMMIQYKKSKELRKYTGLILLDKRIEYCQNPTQP